MIVSPARPPRRRQPLLSPSVVSRLDRSALLPAAGWPAARGLTPAFSPALRSYCSRVPGVSYGILVRMLFVHQRFEGRSRCPGSGGRALYSQHPLEVGAVRLGPGPTRAGPRRAPPPRCPPSRRIRPRSYLTTMIQQCQPRLRARPRLTPFRIAKVFICRSVLSKRSALMFVQGRTQRGAHAHQATPRSHHQRHGGALSLFSKRVVQARSPSESRV